MLALQIIGAPDIGSLLYRAAQLPCLHMPILQPLPRSFYARPAMVVARDCLGKQLVFEGRDGTLSGRIVETEAYLGVRDRAAHSFGGRRSKRNEVMYGPAGFSYVFFIYGMHYHFNLVTDTAGEPTAVLLRAVEPILGEAQMRERRLGRSPYGLTNGPGKLCQAFGIGIEHNGLDLCEPPIYLADGRPPRRVRRTHRIGVGYAGSWAHRFLRFVDPDSPFLSPVARAPR
jgi:DNA-3-methyladenine glycosylase